jgi:hypothetical protein
MGQLAGSTGSRSTITSVSSQSTLFRRVQQMVLLWGGLGVVVGVITSPPDSDYLALVATIIAGLLLLPPMGLVLGLVGGRWNESLLGACVGLVLAMASAMVMPSLAPLAAAGVCVLVGGMMGGTLPVFARLLKWSILAAR